MRRQPAVQPMCADNHLSRRALTVSHPRPGVSFCDRLGTVVSELEKRATSLSQSVRAAMSHGLHRGPVCVLRGRCQSADHDRAWHVSRSTPVCSGSSRCPEDDRDQETSRCAGSDDGRVRTERRAGGSGREQLQRREEPGQVARRGAHGRERPALERGGAHAQLQPRLGLRRARQLGALPRAGAPRRQRAGARRLHPAGARAGRPARRVQPSRERHLGPDGGDRRRLRRPERRVRPRRLPLAVRPAGVHHRERLLQEGEPVGPVEPAAAGRLGLGGRDRARPRHGERRPARAARSCWSRRAPPRWTTSAPR